MDSPRSANGANRATVSGYAPNRNTDFLSQPALAKAFWAYYIICLVLLRFLLGGTLFVIGIDTHFAFTVLHVVHNVILFPVLHWKKGAPFWDAAGDGRYDQETFFEQIYSDPSYAGARKMFTLIPVVLFLLACYQVEWAPFLVFVNVVALGLAVVPKLDFMHHVRIGGINKD